MSWGERSCKHLYEKDPMKNPCHPTMEACNVDCSQYEWDKKTEPDSKTVSKSDSGMIGVGVTFKFGNELEGRVVAAGSEFITIETIGKWGLKKDAIGKDIVVHSDGRTERFIIESMGKRIRLRRAEVISEKETGNGRQESNQSMG